MIFAAFSCEAEAVAGVSTVVAVLASAIVVLWKELMGTYKSRIEALTRVSQRQLEMLEKLIARVGRTGGRKQTPLPRTNGDPDLSEDSDHGNGSSDDTAPLPT